MFKENSIQFNTQYEHSQWIRENRRTGLKEVGCNIVNEKIEVKYIRLF